MVVNVSPQQFELWRDYIYRLTGITLGPDKAYLVEHRLAPLLEDCDEQDLGRLLRRVRKVKLNDPLCQRVIDAITTHETSWFRDPKLFELLERKILPRMHQEIQARRRGPVRIWSAACSTGQEPYSVAMTALEAYRTLGGAQACRREVNIVGSDISRRSLEAARLAIYERASVARGMQKRFISRYLTPQAGGWRIKPEVRALVEFQQVNLHEHISAVGVCDLVLLRNTIIYFSDDLKRNLLRRLPAVMSPGALLFLGTGETASHYSEDFEKIQEEGLVYYRLASGPGGDPRT